MRRAFLLQERGKASAQRGAGDLVVVEAEDPVPRAFVQEPAQDPVGSGGLEQVEPVCEVAERLGSGRIAALVERDDDLRRQRADDLEKGARARCRSARYQADRERTGQAARLAHELPAP